jgi:hypothetical protein
MNNFEFAKLVQEGYKDSPDIIGENCTHPIRINIYFIDGMLNIIPQGSKTFEDWRGDFNIFLHEDREPINHPSLGLMHVDFLKSSLSVVDKLKQKINEFGGSFRIGGHSRGGSQAAVIAGLLANDGLIPEKIYLLEPARIFPLNIPDIYKSLNVWGCWNGNDPVPYAPLFWQQFRLQEIGKAIWPDAAKCHHIDNVVAALENVTIPIKV